MVKTIRHITARITALLVMALFFLHDVRIRQYGTESLR